MKMNTNEKVLNSTVWKNVCFKIGKIFIFAIITFYFVVSLLFFMAPKIDAKIFNFFGLKKAEESCYIRIFEQSGDEIDLYNLIVFEARQGDSSKQLQYINMMLASDDYNEFVVNFNSSSLANLINSNGELEDKKLVPYVCNINSYLLNQKVSCMIDLNFNKSNIENFICVNLESDNLFEFTISTYLNHIVANNSLSQTEKREIQ